MTKRLSTPVLLLGGESRVTVEHIERHLNRGQIVGFVVVSKAVKVVHRRVKGLGECLERVGAGGLGPFLVPVDSRTDDSTDRLKLFLCANSLRLAKSDKALRLKWHVSAY